MVISDIVRLGFAYQAGNPDRKIPIGLKHFHRLTTAVNLSHDLLWGNIHMGTAIVCICLPTYRPLLRHISQVFSSVWSSYNKPSIQKHVDDEVDLKALTTRAKYEHV